MDIVVKGRHTAVPERFRRHAEVKIAKLERFDHKAFRVDAELSSEHNPRMADVRERVELTVFSRGPVIRAEAAAADPYSALDLAAAKLAERLRRAADRRSKRNGAARASSSPRPLAGPLPAATDAHFTSGDEAGPGALAESDTDYPGAESSPLVVREKIHRATPMTLDDALSNMELVGHDFYLFHDVRTGLPSVVYRRCGYDYGVIRLEAEEQERSGGGPDAPEQNAGSSGGHARARDTIATV